VNWSPHSNRSTLALLTGAATMTLWLAALPARANATIAYVKNGKAFVMNDDGTGKTATNLRATFVELNQKGTRLAALDSAHGVVRTKNLTSGAVRRIRLGQMVNTVDWLGNTLLAETATARYAWIWKVGSGSSTGRAIYRQRRDCEESGCSMPVLSISTSPDGKLAALYGQLRYPVVVIRPNGTAAFKARPARGMNVYSILEVAWARDSSKFVAAEQLSFKQLSRMSTWTARGKRTMRLANTKRDFSGLAWAPSGTAIAYGLSNMTTGLMSVYRYSLATKGVLAILNNLEADNDRGPGAWPSDDTLLVGYSRSLFAETIVAGTEHELVRTAGWFDWAAA
jgi:hypothetical protein